MGVPSKSGFGCLVGLVSLLSLMGTQAQTQPLAQSKPPTRNGPCDTARAIGHIKRIVGASSQVVIERASGEVVRRPAPLTPICAADRLKVRDVSQVVIDIHNAPAVTVTRAAIWTAPALNRSTSVTGNVWAFFVDKLAPDVGRVQVQNRTRGPAGGAPKVLLAGVAGNLARLSLADLGPDLIVPIAGWDALESVQLDLSGPNPLTIAGALVGIDTAQVQQARVVAFPTSGLMAGRYVIKVRVQGEAADQSSARETIIGGFEVVDGKAETLQTNSDQSPYDPMTLSALQALWLAQTKPSENGLMAYQIAQRGGSDILPSASVQRLVLSYARSKP